MILSFFICGLGQIYVGKILRGFGFMLSGFALGGIATVVLMGAVANGSVDISIGALIITFVFGIVGLIIWIYSMYDAYQLAKEYNQYVYQYHKKPW